MGTPACSHLDRMHDVEPNTDGCEECLAMGSAWVHLRECLECGHVGCCDSSQHKHATAHFRFTEHPIARSIEPGESWKYCYVDRVLWE